MRKLSSWLDSYLEYTENTESLDIFKVWCGVFCICSALQRKCYMYREKEIYPNMYIVIVAPSGCRKGTALGPAKDLVKSLGLKMAADATTREALIEELEASVYQDFPDDNTTILHNSLSIFSPELGVFLGKENKQLILDLTDWYDCGDTWRYSTKHSGKNEISGVWVNLIGATTPSFLREELPGGAVGGGLTSRMVFVYGDRLGKVISDFDMMSMSEEQSILRDDLLHDLELINLLRGEFEKTTDFKKEYGRWYEKSREGNIFSREELRAYEERRPTHLLKLSMVFSASDRGDMVLRKEDFLRSVRLLELTERDMPKVFEGRGKSTYADVLPKIMAILEQRKRVKSSTLMQIFHQDISSDDLDRIIRTLEKMKFCRALHSQGTILLEYIPKDKRGES